MSRMPGLSATAMDDDSSGVTGDALGLSLPAHAAALREGASSFLTEAFRAAGALAADNRVVRITQFEECPGGSTGRKLLLSVDYEKPAAGLHRELFVKFSRDFDDPIRDRGRAQMELEIRFARLSRTSGFPIAVPVCYFADYHAASGTGLLITQRIGFGREGVEPAYAKCLDDEMPEALAHYQAILRALARLAGAHKAGRLPGVAAQFPFEPERLSVGARAPYSAEQLRRRVARYGEFAARHPGLLPANIRAPAFQNRLLDDVTRFIAQQAAIGPYLQGRADYVALCHWNANVDNAWFWRDAEDRLHCGLMDWGCVSQMNLAMALWGAMSGAETALWDQHLDALLRLFVDEFHSCGGPPLNLAELERQLMLYVAQMGLMWLLDVPASLQALIPDLDAVHSARDPRIRGSEAARSQLQMMVNFLNLWDTRNFGRILDALCPLPRVGEG